MLKYNLRLENAWRARKRVYSCKWEFGHMLRLAYSLRVIWPKVFSSRQRASACSTSHATSSEPTLGKKGHLMSQPPWTRCYHLLCGPWTASLHLGHLYGYFSKQTVLSNSYWRRGIIYKDMWKCESYFLGSIWSKWVCHLEKRLPQTFQNITSRCFHQKQKIPEAWKTKLRRLSYSKQINCKGIMCHYHGRL